MCLINFFFLSPCASFLTVIHVSIVTLRILQSPYLIFVSFIPTEIVTGKHLHSKYRETLNFFIFLFTYLQIVRKPYFLYISVSVFFQSFSRSTYEEFKPSLAQIQPGVFMETDIEVFDHGARVLLFAIYQIVKITNDNMEAISRGISASNCLKSSYVAAEND